MAEWPKASRPRRDAPLRAHMFVTYILISLKTGKYYVGQTNDLEDRIRRHNSNYEVSTKGKGPWQIAHSEEFPTRSQAVARELEIKSYKGGRAFKKLVEN